MAASDQFYRSQKSLDIVFAVSSIVMLLSTIWMFAQDHNRPYKTEQRAFRDVEVALAQDLAVKTMSDRIAGDFKTAQKEVVDERNTLKEKQEERGALQAKLNQLSPKKEKAVATFQDAKADLDSISSFYDIAVEHYGTADNETVKGYKKQIQDLGTRTAAAKAEQDRIEAEIRATQHKLDKIDQPLTKALSRLKKATDALDTQVKFATKKQWGFADYFRGLPIIDGFASPTKIHQITINDIPIDYNFKQVTRFDRCMTCHLGIDRPAYTRENLLSLRLTTKEQEQHLEKARKLLKDRKELLEGLPEYYQVPDPSDLTLTALPDSYLTDARIKQFSAHPRLDLFVGSNSKHPSEKFGCTSCHAGQGSGTEFLTSDHTPNDSKTKDQWKKKYGWAHDHFWDFPMNPTRFVESGCLKCHHQVTDLISSTGRDEAPKLLRGYNLVRENGCFGCHEITGRKYGRSIGPDMRLEANPPLESLTPAERNRILADSDNAPGDLRKVGPSLYRLHEKTHADFVAKWIKEPRTFRPDTRMPHFYNVSNNKPDVLEGGEKLFPDAEVQAMTHYLFSESNRIKELVKDGKGSDDEATVGRLQAKADSGAKLTKEETQELDTARLQLLQRKAGGATVEINLKKDYKEDLKRGRMLFSERGCLSCHRHGGTDEKGADVPAMPSDNQFAPSLSQLTAKLGSASGDKKSAQEWLMKWIKNPQAYSPRTKMPVTHMEDEQIADVAAWLLSQAATDLGDGWDKLAVPNPTDKTLDELAKVYLKRLLSEDDLKTLADKKKLDNPPDTLPDEEQRLVKDYSAERIKNYVGKKAIGRQGCYACHDIPGFEKAKNIGTELNDWGKKNHERLAFEDSSNYVKKHFNIVESLVDGKGKPQPYTKSKPPIDKYFVDELDHKQRTGYLHLKILDPRSYDYNRLRAWDDRARMPEFRFARTIKKKDEKKEDYEARAWKEEADARDAVMTFVLGLVAEQVPTQSINQPKGQHLALAKGRKLLDKYNCAGCHLLQPGSIEFKLGPETEKLTEIKRRKQMPEDYNFLDHHYWTAPPRAPSGDTYRALLTYPKYEQDIDDGSKINLTFKLNEALRMPRTGEPRETIDVRPPTLLEIHPRDLVTPLPAVPKLKDPNDADEVKGVLDRLNGQLAGQLGLYGGTFSDMLNGYLPKKDKKAYEADPRTGESKYARAAAPPSLLGQGGRTQPEWLYKFLLDPQPVRKMSVLRMPRFNMSPDEAQTLVDYFSAVEQLTNPAAGVRHPLIDIPQQEGLDSPYWREKNQEHVALLKERKLYDSRLSELRPIWTQIEKDVKDQQTATQDKLKVFESAFEKAKAAKEAAKNETDAMKKKAAEDAAQLASEQLASWKQEKTRLETLLQHSTLTAQEERWRTKEAYATDAFRFLPAVCQKCHQIGFLPAAQAEGGVQGPPLELASKRLQPEWVKRWLANPQRFLPYDSSMPQNFANDQPREQDKFPGPPLRQTTAVRDVLMLYPEISALPHIRYMVLPVNPLKE